MPFHKLTVTEVITRAGLNRNSFYYHFANIDDMAVRVVEETLMRDLPGILVSELNDGSHIAVDSLLSDKSIRERFNRVCMGSMIRPPIRMITARTALTTITKLGK